MAETLTEQCTERLRRELRLGSLNTRTGFITESGLCKRFKVSRVTIRRCLAILRDENLVRGIPSKGYVCGPAASRSHGTAGSTSKIVQDLVLFVQAPSARTLFDNVHERRIWEGLQEEAERLQLEVQHCRMPLKALVRELKGRLQPRLRGVALDWYAREVSETLLGEGIPAVVSEYMHEGLTLDAVYQDNEAGTEQAVAHFWKEGHRRIGMVSWAEPAFHPLRRRVAFAASMLRRGVLETGRVGASPRFDGAGGYEAATQLFERKDVPSALIINHLEMVQGVFDKLAELGLEPGKDIAIVAWGTPEIYARAVEGSRWAQLDVKLISWSRAEMGHAIVRTLETRRLDPLLPPLRVPVPTELVSSRLTT